MSAANLHIERPPNNDVIPNGGVLQPTEGSRVGCGNPSCDEP